MYQLWCAPPHDSEVVRKWSSRISGSEDESVVGMTALLEPTEGLVMTLQGPVSAFPEPPETHVTPEKDSKLNLKDVSMDLDTPFSQASTAAPSPSASPSASPASSPVGRNAFAMPDISIPMSPEHGKLWAGVDSGSPVEPACLEIPSEVPVPGTAKTDESHGIGACVASKSCKVPKALKVKAVAKCSRTAQPQGRKTQEGLKRKQVTQGSLEPPPKKVATSQVPRRELRAASTAIKFQQANPKRAGSASYTRYERYKGAKTVGEARDAGAQPMDLKVDFDKGFGHTK